MLRDRRVAVGDFPDSPSSLWAPAAIALSYTAIGSSEGPSRSPICHLSSPALPAAYLRPTRGLPTAYCSWLSLGKDLLPLQPH